MHLRLAIFMTVLAYSAWTSNAILVALLGVITGMELMNLPAINRLMNWTYKAQIWPRN